MKWFKENHDMLEVYFWILCAVPTMLWWKESILWVAAMSLYANAKTAHSTHKADQAKREARAARDDV